MENKGRKPRTMYAGTMFPFWFRKAVSHLAPKEAAMQSPSMLSHDLNIDCGGLRGHLCMSQEVHRKRNACRASGKRSAPTKCATAALNHDLTRLMFHFTMSLRLSL